MSEIYKYQNEKMLKARIVACKFGYHGVSWVSWVSSESNDQPANSLPNSFYPLLSTDQSTT